MSLVRIQPGKVAGTVAAPPSKSVTHRAYLLAALSDQPATVQRPLDAADTRATLACLTALGASPTIGPGQVRFDSAPLRAPSQALDCANSGTTLRLLAATVARLPHPVTLTGDASLRRRPSPALLDALHGLGARTRSNAGCAPLTLHGPIAPGTARLPPHSGSQSASALLLSLPLLAGPSVLQVAAPVDSRPYIDLTLAVARSAGLEFDVAESATAVTIHVPGGQRPRLGTFAVEGDWSSAAFLFAAAALTGSQLTVRGLDAASPQGDRAILPFLEVCGCEVRVGPQGVTVQGPQRVHPLGQVDVAATPDLFPVLAVLAAAGNGTTTIGGGSQLRRKESDRIRAMTEGLGRMGIQCEERPDGLVVHGGTLRGANVSSHGDHRIHMAFAVAGLAATGETVVDDAAQAAVSYPSFHDDLRRLGAEVRLIEEARL